jgi:hypothetical protein
MLCEKPRWPPEPVYDVSPMIPSAHFAPTMRNFLRPTSRARLLAIVLGLGWAPSLLAQPFPFNGRWLPDNPPAAPPGYTALTVKGATLTWSGPTKSAPKCVQQFELKNEKPGTVYVDGRGTKFVSGVPGSIPTYLLKISDSTCGNAGEDLRIRYALVYDVTHIEIIEYVNGKPVTSRRFHRKK